MLIDFMIERLEIYRLEIILLKTVSVMGLILVIAVPINHSLHSVMQ